MRKTPLLSDGWVLTCLVLLGAGVGNPLNQLPVIVGVGSIFSVRRQGVSLEPAYGPIQVGSPHSANR